MISELPEKIKCQVLSFLRLGDFKAAKEIHDGWLADKDRISENRAVGDAA